MNITIDQRGCGLGKTTQRIYKRISHNLKAGIKTLVVVPGINLQNQYNTDVDDAKIINNKIYNKYHYKYKSTVSALVNSMREGENLIIITHKTFTLMPKDFGYKNQYDLIIDEAIEEVTKISKVVYKKSQWEVNLNLNQLFEFSNIVQQQAIALSEEDNDWTQISTTNNSGHTLLNDSENFTNLIDNNYLHYVTGHGWRVLTQKTEGEARIVNVLDPHILTGWYDVLITAAAFKYTKMYHWLLNYGYTFNIITDFIPHNNNIKLHTDRTIGQKYAQSAGKNSIIYSNNLIKKYPEVVDNYHTYINKHRTGRVITIRNNHQSKSLPDEEVLSHNVHGMNNYQDITNVNLESALNMDPHIESFYRNVWLCGYNKYHADNMILHFHSAYLFYQVIMRTKLRSQSYANEAINVFTPDLSIATALLDYFDTFNDINEMDLLMGIKVIPKANGRPKITNPKTPYERIQKYRAKKNTEK